MLWALEWPRDQSKLETEMVKQGVNKVRVMAASSLVVLALASAPANANHGHNYVAPLAAFIALNALFHHNHYRGHGSGHRQRYGHGYGHGHGHGYGHRKHRRHSHSHGGYHKPRKKHREHW